MLNERPGYQGGGQCRVWARRRAAYWPPGGRGRGRASLEFRAARKSVANPGGVKGRGHVPERKLIFRNDFRRDNIRTFRDDPKVTKFK